MAVRRHGHEQSELGLLLTGEIKRHEPGILEASALLRVPLMILDDKRLQSVADRCLTASPISVATAGVPSLSEAAAMVGAGRNGSLLGPRISHDGVTCALAMTAAIAGRERQ